MSKRKNYSEFYNKSQNEDHLTKVEAEESEVIDLEIPSEVIRERMAPTLGTVVNCNKLNVRKEPNAGSEIIAVLDKGNQVEIVGESNGFRKVKIDDTFGWCMSFYIEETE